MTLRSALFLCLCLATSNAAAAERIRVAPPKGVAIPAGKRMELESAVLSLGREIEFLEFKLREQPRLHELLPDVRVYHKAVDWALRHDEFLRTNDVHAAQSLLTEGSRRCEQLRAGQAPWTTATGLVVRGFISRLDNSVQPYGLVVPVSWSDDRVRQRRLDVWLHGRDNHLSELKFITDRQRSRGEFTPADTIVLHPYGRYCNAFKFAGEVDVFEAMAAVQRHYAIDTNRVAIRGFSMGGAGCWHLAVHHADVWAAAAPGAGFAETARYTGAFGKFPWPRSFEQQMWRWYDATEYAANLFHCPTIAYSGELDKQKQAADVMAAAMARTGLELQHIIGSGTEHKYEARARIEVARAVDDAVTKGRRLNPDEIRLVTSTLRYNRMHWLTLEGLEAHWTPASINARRTPTGLAIRTENISRFSVLAEAVRPPGARVLIATIDSTKLPVRLDEGNRQLRFARDSGEWVQTTEKEAGQGLRKRPGLQGPIDDAFMEPFLFVRPTGRPLTDKIGRWVEATLARATNEWRAQFRGDVMVKDDVAVTADDWATQNLVIWGDPQSNALLNRLQKELPLRWNRHRVELGGRGFPADSAVPVLIYPNPLNPGRYVVLNSGFTFWNFGDASNAQQTPKLPDFAVLDVTVPLEKVPMRGVIWAGFFDEAWQFPAER